MDIVKEQDLNFSLFHCCGDEDLYPFKCTECGRMMVFCYECDTLYSNLWNLSKQDNHVNHFDPAKPAFFAQNVDMPLSITL